MERYTEVLPPISDALGVKSSPTYQLDKTINGRKN